MKRRKLLVGLGAATAGGSAAFGTEAFTSVEAERSVDVTVAGDQSAYLALSPADSVNADTYVTQSGSGNVIQVDLDGDGSASGGGVNNDAITTFDDLFTILNQGSQPVSVYVEDGSDAVTLRSDESSIEGASNSVELAVGEEMVVSITVDTTGDVSVGDTLTDSVTLWATADDPSPGGTAPVASFNQVVKPDEYEDSSAFADDPKYFADIRGALDAASEGDNVGIDASAGPYSISEGSIIGVDTSGLTIAGTGGRPTITNAALTGNADGAVFEVTAADVTVQNLAIETAASITSNNQAPREISLESGADDATVADTIVRRPDGSGGIRVKGTPTIAARGPSNVEITGNVARGGAISFNGSGGSAVDNVVEHVQTEGIFAFGGIGSRDFTVHGNTVTDHDNEGSGHREIKLAAEPATLNGESAPDDQFEALLTENAVDTVRLAGGDGVVVDPGGSGGVYTSLPTAVEEAGSGFVRVVGTVSVNTSQSSNGAVELDTAGLTIRGESRSSVTVDTSPSTANVNEGISVRASDVTLERLTVVGPSSSSADYGTNFGVKTRTSDGSTLTGITVRDVTVRDSGNVELQLSDVDECLVENVTVDGGNSPTGAGIGIEDTDPFAAEQSITLRDVTAVDNTYGGIGVFNLDSGTVAKDAITGLTLEGNMEFRSSVPPLYVEDENLNTIADGSITDDSGALTHRALIDDDEQSTQTSQETSNDLDRGSYRYYYTSESQAVDHLNNSERVGGPALGSDSEVTIEQL